MSVICSSANGWNRTEVWENTGVYDVKQFFLCGQCALATFTRGVEPTGTLLCSFPAVPEQISGIVLTCNGFQQNIVPEIVDIEPSVVGRNSVNTMTMTGVNLLLPVAVISSNGKFVVSAVTSQNNWNLTFTLTVSGAGNNETTSITVTSNSITSNGYIVTAVQNP